MLEIDPIQSDPFDPLSSIIGFNETTSPFLAAPAPISIDASTQTEETQPQAPATLQQPVIAHQVQPTLKTFKSEPCVSFLDTQYFFTLVEDLSSSMGTRRILIYDLSQNSQGKYNPLCKRLIIFFENTSDGKISASVFCFDFAQNSANIPNASHQIPNTIVQHSYPSLTTLIRRILGNELITILVTLNQRFNIICTRCSQPIFKKEQGYILFPSDGLTLLKCLDIYHTDCVKIPTNENDYVIYKKQL